MSVLDPTRPFAPAVIIATTIQPKGVDQRVCRHRCPSSPQKRFLQREGHPSVVFHRDEHELGLATYERVSFEGAIHADLHSFRSSPRDSSSC